MGPTRNTLPDGRLHLQHGPIDLVIGAEGEAAAVGAAHDDAWARFVNVLSELVGELPQLRAPVGAQCPLNGVIARGMWSACAPFRASFITPMAAVAGAVAHDIATHYARRGITRAWVNNGGDIALQLAPGAQVRVGLFADLARFCGTASSSALSTDAQFTVTADMPVRGIATSGWRGRSFSLGIADSVTVLAHDAAAADAAATVIANAVDLDDARITRMPAHTLKDDSDLGERLVTADVPALPAPLVAQALEAGLTRARALQKAGLVWHAALVCQGQWRTTFTAGAEQLVQ
jgi:ApbE superfamily uncharacterized protein (UPF0280 family)